MPLYPGFHPQLVAVMDYLLWARDSEEDKWFADDYQIAFRTCLNLGKERPYPFATACRETLGLHPDKVWPSIVERRRWLMGKAFREGVDDVTWNPHPELLAAWELGQVRKKPCRSVRFVERKIA